MSVAQWSLPHVLKSLREGDQTPLSPASRRASHGATERERLVGSSTLHCSSIAARKELEAAVAKAKDELIAAKKSLALYSPIEHSAAKTAAREEYYLAERAVEEACRAWCIGARTLRV